MRDESSICAAVGDPMGCVRRTLSAFLVVTASTFSVLGVGEPPSVAAITSTGEVRAVSRLQTISWRTPTLPTDSVVVVNTSGEGFASTVLTLKDASAPTGYSFAMSLPRAATLISDGAGGFDIVLPHALGRGIAR